MGDDVTFDKNFDLVPGVVDEVAPGVRRVLANNGGPFTFKGTLSYIVGRGKVAIVDPGPDDPEHIKALLDGGSCRQGRDRRNRLRGRPAPSLAPAQCRRGAAHGGLK